ncbi:MAG TPA: single-stranded-DNA-specific exonuclease RecJ [Desulfovibrio sp.]|jgi:single-stranded-DNA-specific exonuclease|uniref:single-stranded-DNA-specific exonuclease RecJ n=1 Tax=Desulfovibrio TaxID=872 RepID=UPI0004002174|nr:MULTISPECIES: single-stranded-DNA-specific exonuclease RecJ [Desulfovibrio]MDY0304923.1 single-stranded-DNA-specific exonuclease RecJ [Desulfovibrionaceae bacterium]HMM38795.1 single-stranded-DNA-specific exonuclease RecJ [Desulfovibrio sp.]
MPCLWKPRNEETPPASVAELGEILGVSAVTAGILWSRGLREAGEMDRFLSPGLRHMADPATIPGLTRAAETLARALGEGRKPAIWGDYDVDGITSTALMTEFLSLRGFPARPYLPNRLKEGYGLNAAGMETLAAEGVGVLLTVDCGVSDHASVERARSLGLIVVVSDHHLPGETLPEAEAVCNPRLAADGPFADLAGVGVAFMLAVALNKLLPGAPLDMRRFLDLVALGTVADVVPLTGQNRILVKNGLLLIKEARRPGIAALKAASGYDRYAELGAGQIGFGLAPRINAAGRLGDPGKALDMLLSPDEETARPLALELNALNAERRREEDSIQQEALAQARELLAARPGLRGLALFGAHWHPGVIGIVASRVVEEFYLPTLILCSEGEKLKGSGRSVDEFDLHAGLRSFSDILLGFGGHRQAAGLSLAPENLEPLRERFHAAVLEQVGDRALRPVLKLDRELAFGEISHVLLKELELLQPFGVGNPEPVFQSPPVIVKDRRVFGKDHVKLTLVDAEARATLSGKAWRQAANLTPAVVGRTMRFAYSPGIDDWDGVPRIELHLRDWCE